MALGTRAVVRQAAVHTYILPYSVTESQNAQANWRYCTKCRAMFFNGTRDKGCLPGEQWSRGPGLQFRPELPAREFGE
jgi:hypothetical protein